MNEPAGGEARAWCPMVELDPQIVRRHLASLLAADQFAKSETSRRLLCYLVERSLGNGVPKETEIALDVFGKDASFSGAEDSVVRVGVRALRQKLAEYYAGAGRDDELHLFIPKGGYRLSVLPRTERRGIPESSASAGSGAHPGVAPNRGRRPLIWASAAALVLLVASLGLNLILWERGPVSSEDPWLTQVRSSPMWADLIASQRPVTIVLGDLFMFTQIDPRTGRTQTVRDTEINSSEELRAFLASNPSFAADRGQRYVTMLQKSAAVSLASILRIIDLPGRQIEVTVRDDLQPEQIRDTDVIYIGPLARLGPLAAYYQLESRYRFIAAGAKLTDTRTHRDFLPTGALSGEHMDYALAAKFTGPAGNHILILTSGARNAGLAQIVRMFTSPVGLNAFEARAREKTHSVPRSFEALLTVMGFRQTDLTTAVVDVNPLPMAPLSPRASADAALAAQ